MKTKRTTALMLTLLMGATAMSALSGCSLVGGTPIESSTSDDPTRATKATLTVATYAGGVGKAWLEDAARRFEKLYEKATDFEEGKVGVYIDVDADKMNYGGTTLRDANLVRDVYFTEGVEYYEFYNRNKVADITDVVTGSMEAYDEDGTIEDKLDAAYKNYMTKKTGNKYYMLPFYEGFYGFNYDVDLFEEAGFYFDDAGEFIGLEDGQKASAADREAFETAKSNGPDGKDGTYDDGLPATYAQMMQLLDHIEGSGYVPFCYAGATSYTDYIDKACRAFIADYEGYEKMNANYTFSGTIDVVKSISGGTVATEKVTITEKNAYELQRQPGRYYALSMEEKMFAPKYTNNGNSFGFTEAQRTFIQSKYMNTRYAMMVDGVWWENEADGTFQDIETQRGEKKSDRRFAFLPMPKADESRLGDQTMLSLNSSFCFINKDSKQMKLAKEFMRFLHTDAEMSKFSAKTSIPRALNYTVSKEDRANATHYGKSLIDMRSNAKVVYPYSSVDLVINNSSYFTEEMRFSVTLIGSNEYKLPFDTFDTDKATAEQYFNGMYTYQKGVWEQKGWNK